MFIKLLYQVGRIDENDREEYCWNASLDKDGTVDDNLELEQEKSL
jgi:hypothetical protein